MVDPEKVILPPLHLALALNDLELLKFLLKQEPMQAFLEKLDAEGRTPFYMLITKESKEIKEKEEAARLLLQAGADPTVACGMARLTPLHVVAEQGDLRMLELLLATKAATVIDIENIDGETPLHLAAKAGHDQLVVELLEAGADHEARNHQDQTPRELARSQNKLKTAALITGKVRSLRRAKLEENALLKRIVTEQTAQITGLQASLRLLQESIGVSAGSSFKAASASSSSSGSSSSALASVPAKKLEKLDEQQENKKRQDGPEVVQLLPGEQELYEVDVPGDGTCLFYSVTFAYLLPVAKDPAKFGERFINLFGKEVVESAEENRKRFLDYDGSSRFIQEHAVALEVLVNDNFRKRLVEFMKRNKKELSEFVSQAEDFDTRMERMGDPGRKEWGDQPEIEAISRLLGIRISVCQKQGRNVISISGAEHGQEYEQRIYLVHTTADPRFPSGKNHYHYLIDKHSLCLAALESKDTKESQEISRTSFSSIELGSQQGQGSLAEKSPEPSSSSSSSLDRQEISQKPFKPLTELLSEAELRVQQLEKEIAKLQAKDEKERKEKDEISRPQFLLQYQAQSRFSPKVTLNEVQRFIDWGAAAKEVQQFLDYVAAGQQNEAEAMLKKNPTLALAAGTVTDHAKRTFKNITGFQYAVWALDWHMWKMIGKYLPEKAAHEQVRGFTEGSWVAEYGEYADWKQLMEAQQALIGNWDSWDWQKMNGHWVQQIGGAQLLLPMHVLQEYNQPGRPFDPCPKFDAEYDLIRDPLAGETQLNLGKKLAVYRGKLMPSIQVIATVVSFTPERQVKILKGSGFVAAVVAAVVSRDATARTSIEADRQALNELFAIRTKQRADLVAELVKDRAPSASK